LIGNIKGGIHFILKEGFEFLIAFLKKTIKVGFQMMNLKIQLMTTEMAWHYFLKMQQ